MSRNERLKLARRMVRACEASRKHGYALIAGAFIHFGGVRKKREREQREVVAVDPLGALFLEHVGMDAEFDIGIRDVIPTIMSKATAAQFTVTWDDLADGIKSGERSDGAWLARYVWKRCGKGVELR